MVRECFFSKTNNLPSHRSFVRDRQNARQVYLGGFDAEEQAALACACPAAAGS